MAQAFRPLLRSYELKKTVVLEDLSPSVPALRTGDLRDPPPTDELMVIEAVRNYCHDRAPGRY
jgi:hypothetical protein